MGIGVGVGAGESVGVGLGVWLSVGDGVDVGVGVGVGLDVGEGLERFGERVKLKFKSNDTSERFVEGFVTASLLYCVEFSLEIRKNC